MTVDHPQFGLMCEICFCGLTPEECARDTDGQAWDVCKGECARQAGIREAYELNIFNDPASVAPLRAKKRVRSDLDLGGVSVPQQL